ncbi:MAG: aldo/keto reductase [Dehalococcoidia bacterium]|nr:aldo/keto reductase [Dehalococcoidia bacterium]
MQYRRLGRTHMMAAEVGLGLRSLLPLGTEAAAAVVRSAVLGGCNVVEVETDSPEQLAVVEAVLRQLRPQLIVVGVGGTDLEGVRAAQAAMALDYFDCYLATGSSPDLGALQALATEGLARAVGVSTSDMAEALSAILDGGVELVQIPFNLLELRAPAGVDAVLTAARDADVGVLACSPLAGGRLGAGGERALLEALGFLLDGPHRSVAQAAIAWALSDMRVSAVVAGPASEEQAYENAGASYLAPLEAPTLDAIGWAVARA